MPSDPYSDPAQKESLERQAAAREEMERASRELEKERKRQETSLVKEAVNLLQQKTIQLDEISETFILRRLLSSAFSDSSTERQWAVKALMDLKGMKPQKSSKAAATADGAALLQGLKSAG